MDRSSGTEGGLRPHARRGIRLFGRFFPTQAEYTHPSGLHLHIGARALRKGKTPGLRSVRYWAPAQLGWWIAVLFMVGSFCFALGAWTASFSAAVPALLASAAVQNGIFFTGSLFFTAAATCQLVESRRALRRTAVRFQTPAATAVLPARFAAVGYYASAAQWIGTLLFNANTFDALVLDGGWFAEDLAVWTPDFLGSVCFLVASHFAYLEIRYDASAGPLSRRIVAINYLGAVAFMLSAFCAVALPLPEPSVVPLFASLFTLAGAVCFFVAAYLLIPELAES